MVSLEKNDRLMLARQLPLKSVALILAGGRGTRLKDLTNKRAKPAVHFGGKFRIIDFALSNCLNSGIRRIGVITQYQSHTLVQHIQRGWSFFSEEMNEFVDLLPAQQRMQGENWYRGTADAVLAAADGKPPTGELIAEVMLSDAKYHTPLLRPYMEGGERSDMPYINFYLDYFAQGRPAFVPVEYMDYRDAVELVRDNGGVPVVAHPGLNFRGREETAGRLLDRGAAGLEVFNNYHTPEQAVYFTSLALSKGASMTCGSDFHGKTKPRIAVGRFPSDSRFDGRLSDFVNHIHVIGRQGV